MAAERIQVLGGRVTAMAVEAVLGVERVELVHQPVPVHFSQDRCGGDCNKSTLPDQSFLRDEQIT